MGQTLTTPVQEFADIVDGDAAGVVPEVADLIEPAAIGLRFWTEFKAGRSAFPAECA